MKVKLFPENEVQLEVKDPESLKGVIKWLDSIGAKNKNGDEIRSDAAYIDTEDFAFAHAGIELRMRQSEGETKLDAKCAHDFGDVCIPGANGILQRWEASLGLGGPFAIADVKGLTENPEIIDMLLAPLSRVNPDFVRAIEYKDKKFRLLFSSLFTKIKRTVVTTFGNDSGCLEYQIQTGKYVVGEDGEHATDTSYIIEVEVSDGLVELLQLGLAELLHAFPDDDIEILQERKYLHGLKHLCEAHKKDGTYDPLREIIKRHKSAMVVSP